MGCDRSLSRGRKSDSSITRQSHASRHVLRYALADVRTRAQKVNAARFDDIPVCASAPSSHSRARSQARGHGTACDKGES